jgi:3-hydroxyisobutyrate dehydrogenase-like beta-hydroxyacid dehydrogenase
MSPRICFIGFGEAGQAMAAGLREEGVADIAAWDILFPDRAGAKLVEAANRTGVRVATSAADAVRDAEIVIAAVTAASSAEAAQSVAGHLQGEPFYLDVNSVSPARKRANAKLLGDGARYIDVAIVSAIHPERHKSPMMLAGRHAQAAEPALATLGMRTQIVGEAVGDAAAIKMIRSVMIKGIEALTLECFLAASRAGVFDQVAASLRNNYPTLDWNKLADYNIERMASHGIRRAAEMREVADTLRELGVAPLMTSGTIERQQQMGEIGREPGIKAAAAKGGAAMLQEIGKVIASFPPPLAGRGGEPR